MYAMASEDMDSLTFATPRLVRQLMTPASQKLPVTEYDYRQARAPVSAHVSSGIAACPVGSCSVLGLRAWDFRMLRCGALSQPWMEHDCGLMVPRDGQV